MALHITNLVMVDIQEIVTLSVIIYNFKQVLHLMNKMNLPCPFGPVTARPPMVSLFLFRNNYSQLLSKPTYLNKIFMFYTNCSLNSKV